MSPSIADVPFILTCAHVAIHDVRDKFVEGCFQGSNFCYRRGRSAMDYALVECSEDFLDYVTMKDYVPFSSSKEEYEEEFLVEELQSGNSWVFKRGVTTGETCGKLGYKQADGSHEVIQLSGGYSASGDSGSLVFVYKENKLFLHFSGCNGQRGYFLHLYGIFQDFLEVNDLNVLEVKFISPLMFSGEAVKA